MEEELLLACFQGKLEQVEQLLQSPTINVNVQNDSSWTPVLNACFKGI